MLAPPNHGSFVATAATSTFGRLLKPVAELSTQPESLVNRLPMPADVEVGVIAAAYDALVTEESTHPDVPHAHVTLPTWHTGLLFRPETAELVDSFLATGSFQSGRRKLRAETTETVRSGSETMKMIAKPPRKTMR